MGGASNVVTVGALKRHLSQKGLPRFRQKLFDNGYSYRVDLRDDEELEAPMDLHVVAMDFCETSAQQVQDLIDAVEHLDNAIIEEILKRPQNPDYVNNIGDETPLYKAVDGVRDLSVARLLMKAGADPHCPSGPNGDTPFMAAIRSGSLPMLKLLLEFVTDVDACCHWGDTALGLACRCGHTDLVLRLLAAGADVNKVCSVYAETPLGAACEGGNPEVVRALLSAGANADFNELMDIASREGHDDVVNLLWSWDDEDP